MSVQLINHSPDLKKLRDEGYSVYIKNGLLFVEDVPYVNNEKQVAQGTLISKLAVSGNTAKYDNQHVVFFTGSQPYHATGKPLDEIIHPIGQQNHGNGIITNIAFSSKPAQGYKDYHHKMTNYINILESQAKSIDPNATARLYRAMTDDEDSVFNYIDTNSSRAAINFIGDKLKHYQVGIVGLGGTGSYILDLVSKTPVTEIHLFDGDIFYSHNAFRSPSAASLDVLNSGISKVQYLTDVYSNMHKKITAHDLFMSEEHLDKLSNLNFIFIAVDDGPIKEKLFSYLDTKNIPFIDVGLGVNITDEGQLRGIVRTTMFTSPEHQEFLKDIDFNESHEDAYNTNIQIAELNALNASLAVIKWKRYAGFYQTTFSYGHTLFNLDTLGFIRK